MVIQCPADRTDHSVYHTARGDDIRAALCMGDRDLRQHVQGWIVQHITFRQAHLEMLAGIQNPTVAMIGIFAQAYIGHHDHLRDFLLDGADRLLDYAIPCKIFKTNRIFLFGNSKENHGVHTGLYRCLCLLNGFLHRQLIDPWHRADLTSPYAIPHK